MNPTDAPVPDVSLPAAPVFLITINGKAFCEADDLTTATIVVEELRRRVERRITLYASGHEGRLHWMTANLTVGDRIVIEIADAMARSQLKPRKCDFCGRDAHDVHALVRGPAGSICDICIATFSAAVHKGTPLPAEASFRDDSTLSCRFCGKAPPAIAGVVMQNGAGVCAECLRSCADMLADSQPGNPPDETGL